MLPYESWFNNSYHDSRIRVYRRRGDIFSAARVLLRDSFGVGSFMVWGGIMANRKTDLVFLQGNLNAPGYITEVLSPVSVPVINANGPASLMHDDARPTTARLKQTILNEN